jgi:ubiquinone/menaquinone biosynthesis C-methylase UbiE
LLKKALQQLLRVPKSQRLRVELQQRFRIPANPLVSSASNVQKYIPYPARRGYYVLQKADRDDHERNRDGFPIPPEPRGYGDTEENWLNSGKTDVDSMLRILNYSNFFIEKGNRILELGCATGRMTRWLASLAEECEIWGVDISARGIVWCQENLTPPFNFATVTTVPNLPFEDRYFDFIFCGSVFTHIDDLADAWLLEIKRIMRPGGRAYVTVHDKHTADVIINNNWESRELRDLVINNPNLAPREMRNLLISSEGSKYINNEKYYKISLLPGNEQCQVFYDIEHLRQHWGRWLKIITVIQEAWWFQTAVLMEK